MEKFTEITKNNQNENVKKNTSDENKINELDIKKRKNRKKLKNSAGNCSNKIYNIFKKVIYSIFILL